jgi:hypothetical protein
MDIKGQASPFSKLLIGSVVPFVTVVLIGVDDQTEVGIVLNFRVFWE